MAHRKSIRIPESSYKRVLKKFDEALLRQAMGSLNEKNRTHALDLANLVKTVRPPSEQSKTTQKLLSQVIATAENYESIEKGAKTLLPQEISGFILGIDWRRVNQWRRQGYLIGYPMRIGQRLIYAFSQDQTTILFYMWHLHNRGFRPRDAAKWAKVLSTPTGLWEANFASSLARNRKQWDEAAGMARLVVSFPKPPDAILGDEWREEGFPLPPIPPPPTAKKLADSAEDREEGRSSVVGSLTKTIVGSRPAIALVHYLIIFIIKWIWRSEGTTLEAKLREIHRLNEELQDIFSLLGISKRKGFARFIQRTRRLEEDLQKAIQQQNTVEAARIIEEFCRGSV